MTPQGPPKLTLIFCRTCDRMTQHTHWHDAAHGIAGTHMAGTERFVCEDCSNVITVSDPQAKHISHLFIFDTP